MSNVPPPPPKRTVAFYDTECYPNYWLLKLKPRGLAVHEFRMYAGQSLSSEAILEIRALFEEYTTISFNGRGYDVPMISAALIGHCAEQMKFLNDRIIVERTKPWELGLPEWQPRDHIDIMEVAPGAGSQKQYAGRIHYKTMRDLPYEPNRYLTDIEILEVDTYCENDLAVLEALYDALQPQLKQREALTARYGIDLRSKSDAQVAEAVLKFRCEQVTGRKLYKPDIDWNLSFKYKVPTFVNFYIEVLQNVLRSVEQSVFSIGANGTIGMPSQLEGLLIPIGATVYKMGIGGLHSQEKRLVAQSDDTYIIRDADVAAYYPNLILNSGEVPSALGYAFVQEYQGIVDERLSCKSKVKSLEALGDTISAEYEDAKVGDDGGKIMINGSFGKTGSPYSILFAPSMLIQTTITGQLALLILIEWHEMCGISIISANTDGILIKCPRLLEWLSEHLIKEWEKLTGLTMEISNYRGIYMRDVNNYIAVKSSGDVKRKGEYAKSGLVEKKNPDVEICADAVATFLANGTPVEQTIRQCFDIRKFITIVKVSGGGVKMWGEGVRKDIKVSEMIPTIEVNGWVKNGRRWTKEGRTVGAFDAYSSCFAPQRPEYLGKVVRWYYSTQSPGPIVYATNGNTVGMSYGAKPCMTLTETFTDDIDYDWYIKKARGMLNDLGLTSLSV